MNFQTISYKKNEKVATITLKRLEAANSLSSKMIDELFQVIQTINNDKTIACTIFTGYGDKVFCAGADLKERKKMNDEQVEATVKNISDLFYEIEHMHMPTIAAINGVALGGGLELALSCDIRMSYDDVLLGLTETSLAIIPGGGGTQRLARQIGIGQAKKMIYTSEKITGQKAYELGLIEVLANKAEVYQKAKSLAKKISENGPLALRFAKKAIQEGFGKEINEGLQIEHYYYKKTIPTKDRKEALLAFEEKRKPIYYGK